MITRNPMQLKAFIKKKAAEKNISAQLVMQRYMLERLLERISLSTYLLSLLSAESQICGAEPCLPLFTEGIKVIKF